MTQPCLHALEPYRPVSASVLIQSPSPVAPLTSRTRRCAPRNNVLGLLLLRYFDEKSRLSRP